MESWVKISLILCTFGFLKELRPSEPFVTEYIIEFKNVTVKEVVHVAFPVSTYATLISLIFILLITDVLRYKPIVVLEGICHVLAWGILTFSSGLTALVIAELFYGIAASAELAYSTYIYAQVDKEYYKKVTSNTYSARLGGKFFGGLIAQLLVTFSLLNYHQLNYITLTCTTIGFLATLFLPWGNSNHQFFVKWKHNAEINDNHADLEKCNKLTKSAPKWTIANSINSFILDLKTAYGNIYVLKWTLWWALASAGQYQVINYIQALWEVIREDGEGEVPLYNGGVKAIHTFFSAILSLSIGYVNISWKKWGESCLIIISIVQGFLLAWMSQTNSLYSAYFSYIIFRTLHPMMITVASAEVAQCIRKDSHGLIFGINTFIALILQTSLTLIVTDTKGLALDERSQYVVYGICFIVLGLLIGFTSIVTCGQKYLRSKKSPIPVNTGSDEIDVAEEFNKISAKVNISENNQ